MMKKPIVIAMALSLSACGPVTRMAFSPGPQLATVSVQASKLKRLPPPKEPVYAAVYSYQDLTGQYKPSANVQTLSRSVTQGADTMLVRALQDAGDRSWFRVVERGNLDALLKERQIVTQIRKIYLGEDKVDPEVLPPLLYAGVLFEGGVVGYDSNTRTGGAGARYLGIGGNADYRQDDVTVSLRAVSTRTGEVMANVMVQKSVVSVGVKGGAFRYIALDEILEAEAGITKNEPVTLAVQQAIEKAVYSIVMEGARVGAWSFENPAQANALYQEYTSEKAQVTLPVKVKKARPPSNNGAYKGSVPLAWSNLWANKKS